MNFRINKFWILLQIYEYLAFLQNLLSFLLYVMICFAPLHFSYYLEYWSKSLWQYYINAITEFLDTIHRPAFYVKQNVGNDFVPEFLF